jgi:hypothetical protein
MAGRDQLVLAREVVVVEVPLGDVEPLGGDVVEAHRGVTALAEQLSPRRWRIILGSAAPASACTRLSTGRTLAS